MVVSGHVSENVKTSIRCSDTRDSTSSILDRRLLKLRWIKETEVRFTGRSTLPIELMWVEDSKHEVVKLGRQHVGQNQESEQLPSL